MTRRNAVLGVVFLVASLSVAAAPVDFRIFLDVDADVATGCTVAGMAGVDQVLVTRVDSSDTEAEVTRTFRQLCTNGVLGGETDVTTTNRPAGFNAGNGDLLIETRLPFSATGEPDSLRIGITAGNGTVHTETLEAHETIAAKAASPVGRRRSASAPPRTFILDGIGSDWAGLEPLIDGIAASGTASLRILKFFAFANDADDHYYFRFDANLTDDAPYANDDEFVRPAGEGLSISAAGVLSNDGDPLGSALVALPVSPATHGEVVLNPDGSFTYTPDDPASTQNDLFEYRASNGAKTSASAVVRINVHTAGNAAPFGNADTYETGEDELLAVPAPGVLQNDTDADADALTAALLAAPAHGSVVVAANGGFTYSPSEEFTGSDAFTYTVSDGTNSATATVTIYVGGSNDVPSVSPATFSIAENSAAGTIVGDVDVIDNDAADTHQFSIVGGNSGNAFAISPQSGAITVAGALNFEARTQYSLIVRATDNGMPPRADEETITIRVTDVNEAPVAVADHYMVAEGGTLVEGPTVLVNDTDPDGDALTVTLARAPSHAAAFTLHSDGTFTYTHDGSESASDQFSCTISDGVHQASAVVQLAISPVNDGPQLLGGAPLTFFEDTPQRVPWRWIQAADPDSSFARVKVVLAWEGASFTFGTMPSVTVNTSGPYAELTGTVADVNAAVAEMAILPPPDQTGAPRFEIRAFDLGDFGAKPMGGVDYAFADIAVQILPIDDAPRPINDSYEVTEGGTISRAAQGVMANDHDPEGNALTASLVDGPSHAASFSLGADGSFTYTHDGSEQATDSFTYSVSDGNSSAQTTVTFTITPVNDPVVVTAALPATVEEDTSTGLGLSMNDPDGVDAPVRATLQAVNGTVSIRPQAGLTFLQGDGVRDALVEFTGTLAYVQNAVLLAGFTPAPDFAGEATITLTADDGASTATATHSITVTPINDDPWVQAPGVLTFPEDTPVPFPPGSLFVLEPDGPTARVKVAMAFTGVTATFGVSDGVTVTHDWSQIEVTGTVEKVNAALASMTLTLPANTSGEGRLDLYAFDLGDFGDLTPNSIGSSWSYVVLNVVPVNDAPVNILPAAAETMEGSPLGIVAEVQDPEWHFDGSVLEVTLSVTNGTLQIASDSASITGNNTSSVKLSGTYLQVNGALGYLTYTPTPGFNGTAQLTMTSNDRDADSAEGALQDTDVLEITVTPVNDPVMASAQPPFETFEDSSAPAGVGISDGDGGNAQVNARIDVTNGSVSLRDFRPGITFVHGDGKDDALLEVSGTLADVQNTLGNLYFVPSAHFFGTATVTLTASDGASTSSATQSITMISVNDLPDVTKTIARLTFVEDTPLAIEPGSFVVNDPDAGSENIYVQVGWEGTVIFGDTDGLTVLNDGSTVPALIGPQDKINAALSNMTLIPMADLAPSSERVLEVWAHDFGGEWGAAYVPFTILAVNDAPVNGIPADLETAVNTPLPFVPTIHDVDAFWEGTVETKLAVTGGTLTVGSSIATISGNGTSEVTFTGPLREIRRSLLGTTFHPAVDFVGTAQLTMTTNDLGTFGAGGALEDVDVAAIAVTAAP